MRAGCGVKIKSTQWESSTDDIDESEGRPLNHKGVLSKILQHQTRPPQHKFNQKRCHPELNHNSITEVELKQKAFEITHSCTKLLFQQ